jgi:predicted SAM-dependent methyltransferase
MGAIKLNLGCGNNTPAGWVNIDYAFGARFAKIPFFSLINKRIGLFQTNWDKKIMIHDLRRTFPFADSSVDIIYTSHTLEHFSKNEGVIFLKECHRILKGGGIIRIVTPDLEAIAYKYIMGKTSADVFLDELYVVCDTSGMGFFKKLLANYIAFNHKCMYDTKTLIRRLNEIGFQAENRAPLESVIPDIKQIERESRTINAVIVEAKRLNT